MNRESEREIEPLDAWGGAGYSALGAMIVVWLWTGWYILTQGGFFSTARYTRHVTYLDGPAAMMVATMFFCLAAISAAAIANRFNAPRGAAGAAAATILGLPVVYLLVRAFV